MPMPGQPAQEIIDELSDRTEAIKSHFWLSESSLVTWVQLWGRERRSLSCPSGPHSCTGCFFSHFVKLLLENVTIHCRGSRDAATLITPKPPQHKAATDNLDVFAAAAVPEAALPFHGGIPIIIGSVILYLVPLCNADSRSLHFNKRMCSSDTSRDEESQGWKGMLEEWQQVMVFPRLRAWEPWSLCLKGNPGAPVPAAPRCPEQTC